MTFCLLLLCSMFCCTLLYVHSSIAIILMGKRELVALLNLSSWCLVMVEQLFLTVPWGCLRFVIVVFPDHTHLLFLDNLQFLYIFQFMASSLEKLLETTDKADFKITESEFDVKTDTILRKGVYPYEYIDSQERLKETKLPPIEAFYSKLSDETISQKRLRSCPSSLERIQLQNHW